ncbi:MAG TPA: DUF3000 domain-containing protein [Candidatus Nanopelagicaceae bacterium]|nr:DUF3000 domain-containing protein [Candidatus Nanopelagicaceae bacterium]
MSRLKEQATFDGALKALRGVKARPEIVVEEAPAPARLAPYAVALTADVLASPGADDDLATGRFVLLYDPAGHEAWDGSFRCVTFARAQLESEMETDPLLPEIGWSWLLESLAAHNASFLAPSGTVTRVASQSFGQLADREPSAEIEIRASWTPKGTIDAHLAAWFDVLATCAGLPPMPEGVALISGARRGTR